MKTNLPLCILALALLFTPTLVAQNSTASDTITSDQLTASPSTSAALALQGLAAGVLVHSTDNTISASTFISIRGLSASISAAPIIIVDGVKRSNLDNLNANDVESIEIVKNSYAAAIYGVSGGDGVIVVTTKRPAEVPVRITYNSFVAVGSASKLLPAMTAAEYAPLAQEYYLYNRSAVNYTDEEVAAFGEGTAWQKEIYRTAVSHSHYLSVSGTLKRFSYNVAGSFLGQQGVMIHSNRNRTTLRAEVDYRPTEWITIGANASVAQNHTLSGKEREAAEAALIYPSTLPIYDASTPYGYSAIQNASSILNPPRGG